MRKTLTIVTALALGTIFAGCDRATAPAESNAAAEANEVVDTVDANAVDANAVDANAADNAVDAGNDVTEQGSTDHGSTDH